MPHLACIRPFQQLLGILTIAEPQKGVEYLARGLLVMSHSCQSEGDSVLVQAGPATTSTPAAAPAPAATPAPVEGYVLVRFMMAIPT